MGPLATFVVRLLNVPLPMTAPAVASWFTVKVRLPPTAASLVVTPAMVGCDDVAVHMLHLAAVASVLAASPMAAHLLFSDCRAPIRVLSFATLFCMATCGCFSSCMSCEMRSLVLRPLTRPSTDMFVIGLRLFLNHPHEVRHGVEHLLGRELVQHRAGVLVDELHHLGADAAVAAELDELVAADHSRRRRRLLVAPHDRTVGDARARLGPGRRAGSCTGRVA